MATVEGHLCRFQPDVPPPLWSPIAYRDHRIPPIVHLLRHEDGPTSVEYAVMLALIIVVCIGAVTTVGGEVFNMWGNNGTELGGVFDP